ncbi:MAG: hypothetical protein K1X92_17595 [Bacteroidia bacterium]|nr:hypothetical protein [Bacteroidia bacterium]
MKKINITDGVFLGLSLIAVYLSTFLLADFTQPPIEDAAMLMRYAKHLGEGYGIVWNKGEKPVDGATDFLFMCAVAFLYKTGFSIEGAVRALTLSAHLLTVLFVYLYNRFRNKTSVFWAGMLTLYLILNPGIYFTAVYFGTPFFAFWVVLTAAFLQEIVLSESYSVPNIAGFSVFGLIASLTRPEGIIWVACGLGMIVWVNRKTLTTESGIAYFKKSGIYFFLLYFLPALLYFLWHWYYFGYPLPNPLYRKGGGTLYPMSLIISVYLTGMLMLPLIPVFLWEFFSGSTPKISVYTVIPVGVFTVAFFFLSNEMNYGARFQYCVLPVILISPLWKKEKEFRHFIMGKLKEYNRILPDVNLLFYALVIFGFLIYPYVRYSRKLPVLKDGKYEAATIMATLESRNYTLATTEAGILPFYSRWRAIDTWGLNDKEIAHSGQVTAAYLDTYRPEVIMIDGAILEEKEKQWGAMLDTLYRYAQSRHYTLATHFYEEDPEFNHYYYVRDSFPDRQFLINSFRGMKYEGVKKKW